MQDGPDSTTYMVEINGAAPRKMTIATPYMECAASAVSGVFGVEADAFPLHIMIWIEELVSDRNPPNTWVIWESRAALNSAEVDSGCFDSGGIPSQCSSSVTIASFFSSVPGRFRPVIAPSTSGSNYDPQANECCRGGPGPSVQPPGLEPFGAGSR